jgi:hypothetical protein
MKPVSFSVIASEAKQPRAPSLSLPRKRGRVGVGDCFVGFASSQ